MELPSNTRRKLRVLVITMGSQRQEYISAMFSAHPMPLFFEPPTFTPGVPSRELRNKYRFFMHAGESGILPIEEWDAIQTTGKTLYEQGHSDWLEKSLESVPVSPTRQGWGKDSPYAIELWYRAKSINRGRSVLACAFAHFKAMRKLVEGEYDLILEDNVRAPLWLYPPPHADVKRDPEHVDCECAERIWRTLESSLQWEKDHLRTCHLRYYGWLGSRPNLEFIFSKFIHKTRSGKTLNPSDISIFPFPITSDFSDDSVDAQVSVKDLSISENVDSEERTDEITHETCASDVKIGHTTAGGTPIWGAYAYWISNEAYRAMMQDIQRDVGALLWKGKRMRFYTVKPIDKVMPRRVIAVFSPSETISSEPFSKEDFNTTQSKNQSVMEWSRECVHVTTHPAFFRAPMLTSKIHKQYDPEFCKSTEFQMSCCQRTYNTGWDQLWLPDTERMIVEHRRKTGKWQTLQDMEFANRA